MKLSEIILAIGLDKVQFVFHYEILVDDPEHIGDIQNHIIRDILKEETEGIVIKRGPKSCPMLIKGIWSIRLEIILVVLDIIGYQIGTVTRLKDFTTDETFDAYDRILIESYLDIVSGFRSAQLRLGRKVQIDKIFDEKVPISIDDESLIRDFDGIYI